MGSKVGGSPGEIVVEDYQDALQDISLERLKQTMAKIRQWLGYESYDVSLYLIDDEEMAATNLQTRNVNSPTDILSFAHLEDPKNPGQLRQPEIDSPVYYNLGEMLIDVPYVLRQIQEDLQSANEEEPIEEEDDDDDEPFVYDDRGVSAAMEKITGPELRIHMLLVHGMLHLVGYDHVKDEDYELMVHKEEELLVHLGFPTATNSTGKNIEMNEEG